MPFRDPQKAKSYTRDYQARVREGERVNQPETLEDALAEVRELRTKFLAQFEEIWLLENAEPQNLPQALAETRRLRKRVVQNSKRLWFLKNKEKQNVRQRRHRRSTDLQKALMAMRKIDQATKNPTYENSIDHQHPAEVTGITREEQSVLQEILRSMQVSMDSLAKAAQLWIGLPARTRKRIVAQTNASYRDFWDKLDRVGRAAAAAG